MAAMNSRAGPNAAAAVTAVREKAGRISEKASVAGIVKSSAGMNVTNDGSFRPTSKIQGGNIANGGVAPSADLDARGGAAQSGETCRDAAATIAVMNATIRGKEGRGHDRRASSSGAAEARATKILAAKGPLRPIDTEGGTRARNAGRGAVGSAALPRRRSVGEDTPRPSLLTKRRLTCRATREWDLAAARRLVQRRRCARRGG